MGTDLAVNCTVPLAENTSLFARGDVLNVFNTQRIVDPSLINTDVTTSRTGLAVVYNADGSIKTLNSGLAPFNPFTDTPVECPRGTAAAGCAALHANYQLGTKFGQANSADAYQLANRSLAPRTYRLSVGLRF